MNYWASIFIFIIFVTTIDVAEKFKFQMMTKSGLYHLL